MLALKKSCLFVSLMLCTLVFAFFGARAHAEPPSPAGLIASPADAAVTLRWDAVPGAKEYKVLSTASDGGKFKVIAKHITSTTYTHTGLSNGTTYWYKVAAVDLNGETGSHSDTASASPGTVGAAPPAPAALIAVAGNGQARLSWEPSSNAAGYAILRKTSSTGSYTTIASGVTGTSYTDTGLNNGTIYYYAVVAANSGGSSGESNVARITPVAPPATGSVFWPMSKSAGNDGNEIRYPYGPRRPGEYDFHAGIDMNAPEGTPVYAVMDGTVTNITPDDGKHGPGNKVLVNHGNQHWTGYLHLSAFAPGLTVGQSVKAGDLIGYVGHTGANSDHLHVTYMVGLTAETNNESRSKNPLEIMPHNEPTVTASFRTDDSNTVDVHIPVQQNTIRWIILKGQGQTKIADYYDIVGQGTTKRNNQSQYGMYIDVDEPVDPYPAGGGTMHFTIRPDPSASFVADRVIIKDFNGNTLVDKTKKTNKDKNKNKMKHKEKGKIIKP